MLEQVRKETSKQGDKNLDLNSKTSQERLVETYQYFLMDICHLVSIRECIVSLEQTTRKEHYNLQQKINKLNKDAEKFSQFGSKDIDIAAVFGDS